MAGCRELLAGGAALCVNGCTVVWPRIGGDELAGTEMENREIFHCFPLKGNNWQYWHISSSCRKKYLLFLF